MAERRISTRLAVEGESQYKAAISSVNAELRNMQSALKETESQYKNNANSIEALTAKDRALNNLLAVQKQKVQEVEAGLRNAQKAEEQYTRKKEELTKQIEKNNRALEELKNSTEDTTDEQKRLKDENDRLNAELEENEAKLKASKRAVTNWKTELNNAKTAVNNTKNAIDENANALKQHEQKTKANEDAINALAAAMVASGLKMAIREIVEALRDCVNASVEFESAMAGVAKTTDLSKAELSKMGEDIKQLSTEIPVAATEIAGIVEVAGQLGIAKEDLLSFSTVMANLGVATNMTSEEAATLLARFANVTQMSPDLYENLGSTIVALGNNMATTESEIVILGQRLAAAGELAGLTEPEIMALAAAMTSVGIQAEAGGTAMTQTLTAMEAAVAGAGEDLEKFAQISGMSAEQFAQTWQEKPIEAVQAFIEGLGKLDEQGESATLVLEEMGLSGVRQSNMLKSLATASGLLGDAVNLANTAWAENTALMKEASTRYETTESKFQMFKNSVDNLKIAVGDQLTPALGDLAERGTNVTKWATEFVQANEWLAPAISAVAAALAVLLGYVTTATIVIPLLTKLFAALSASFLASPAGLVAAGLSMVVAAAAALALTLPPADKEMKELRKSMEECNKAFEEAESKFNSTMTEIEATSNVVDRLIKRLEELDKKTQLTAEEQAEYNAIVAQLQELLPNVNIQFDEVTGKLATTTDEIRRGAQAWREYAEAQAYSTILAEQKAALVATQVTLEKTRLELGKYYGQATDGAYEYRDALKAESDAAIAFAQAVEEANGKETEAVTAARQKRDEAIAHVGELHGKLSELDLEIGEKIFELEELMGELDAQVEEQSALLEETQAMIDTYKSKIDETTSATGELADETERANDSLSTLGEGAAEGLEQIPEAAETAMNTTQETITAAAPEIQAQVADMGTQSAVGFEEGLAPMPDSANKAMSDTVQKVSSFSGSAYSAGYSVGAAISQGAAAGVMAYAAQVAAQAAAMVRNAIQAAKNAAASASPSKKMIQLGRDLDEGLIIGIRQLEGKVIDSIEDTMRKVVSVEVDPPTIPDNVSAFYEAMSAPKEDDRLYELLQKALSQRNQVNINNTQNIYAEDTSYVGQQREAKRNMKELARMIGR